MRKLVISCTTLALSMFALATGPANAAPVGLHLLKSATSNSAVAEKVHWRGYRHCHRRYGYRRCHGGYAYYGYGPSIVLGFGGRRHHHHHFRGFRGGGRHMMHSGGHGGMKMFRGGPGRRR
jgi:hypothetical protein